MYGLLVNKITGWLIFDDSLLVLRLEPDGTLLTLAGSGNFLQPLSGGSTLASALNVAVCGAWRKIPRVRCISPTPAPGASIKSRRMET